MQQARPRRRLLTCHRHLPTPPRTPTHSQLHSSSTRPSTELDTPPHSLRLTINRALSSGTVSSSLDRPTWPWPHPGKVSQACAATCTAVSTPSTRILLPNLYERYQLFPCWRPRTLYHLSHLVATLLSNLRAPQWCDETGTKGRSD